MQADRSGRNSIILPRSTAGTARYRFRICISATDLKNYAGNTRALSSVLERKCRARPPKICRMVQGCVCRNNRVPRSEGISVPNRKLMDKLINEPWRGDSFSGRIWENQKQLAVGLNDILLAGLQQGKTVTEIAISLHNYTGNSFNNCHRLIRTETMHYLNSAVLMGYKDGGVERVRVWAALDERTCETCMRYHDKVYPLGKEPILPLHSNCRCTYLPEVE